MKNVYGKIQQYLVIIRKEDKAFRVNADYLTEHEAELIVKGAEVEVQELDETTQSMKTIKRYFAGAKEIGEVKNGATELYKLDPTTPVKKEEIKVEVPVNMDAAKQ